MPVVLQDDRLTFVRLELELSELERLLDLHRRHWEAPERLESSAIELVRGDFPPSVAKLFAIDVIRWGGGERFSGRFATANVPEKISSALRDATVLAKQGQTPGAVTRVQELKYLGQSFASKMVRFLRPGDAVILDSVIRGSLGYPETEAGYAAFLADCRSILDVVRTRLPCWRVCEVEAVIFAKLQGY